MPIKQLHLGVLYLELWWSINSGHDTDGDEMVDGLELYKAIHHAKGHKESYNHALPEESPPPGVPTIQFDTSIDDLIEGRDDFGAVGNKIYCSFLPFISSSNN